MVYSAYRSKACAECRLRRTKCDYLRPSCSQCIRAGRECKGYRDFGDFMFCDESEEQVVKHQLRREASAKLADPKLKKLVKKRKQKKEDKVPGPNLKPAANITSLVADGLRISPEEQATCYFFHNYVLAKGVHVGGSFHYLADVFSREKVGPGLSDSVAALGLVGLSHLWQSPKLLVGAQMKYNSALRQISTQLRDVEKAKADQTLISVMLLAFYEINTCNSRRSMDAWTKHVTGAASLLDFRGKEQLETEIGRQLFVHLRSQVITNCMQRHVEVPPVISEWSKALEETTPNEEAAIQLSELNIKYCNLRASMSSFHDFTDQGYVISSACALDAEFAEWASRHTNAFPFQIVNLNDRSEWVFSDHYHVYSDVWVATVWNNYRAVRILINELILVQLSQLYPFTIETIVDLEDQSFFADQMLASSAILSQLSHDVCASVPYFLGCADGGSTTDFSAPKMINGNLLLWPLYVAASTSMALADMRIWAIGRLRWISKTMGIRQAGPLAYALSINQELRDWQVGGGCSQSS